MTSYRLYFMDRFSGHISDFREFDADDDRGAARAAARMRDGRPMELWCRTRKVERWEAEPIQPVVNLH